METSKDNNLAAAVSVLVEHAREIIAGSFKNVDRIFRLTDEKKYSPEIAELAETFGMMSVKVEAREYALEQTIAALREKTAALENERRIRTQLTSIFISVVLLITFYTFVLGFLNSGWVIRHESINSIKVYISRGLEILTLLIVIRMILVSRLPLRSFGLTLAGWKRSIVEALLVSAVVIGFLIAFKIAAQTYRPGLFKESELVRWAYFDYTYVIYLVVAPLQEFITRGTVQSTLARLFTGRTSGLLAVMVTAFLFGALHVYASINLAVMALLTSWLWGWMYNRHKSLIGVSLSHFLIGDMAGLMGYWNFF